MHGAVLVRCTHHAIVGNRLEGFTILQNLSTNSVDHRHQETEALTYGVNISWRHRETDG
jgi:hypothetical protein